MLFDTSEHIVTYNWSSSLPYLRREVPGMPKKFQGENSKSATARARKAEAKAVEDARKQKELEDALWQDNDKHVMKKEQRRVGLISWFNYIFPLEQGKRSAFGIFLKYTITLIRFLSQHPNQDSVKQRSTEHQCLPYRQSIE